MSETTATPRDERAVVHGYGQCAAGGCRCVAFSGPAGLCANCGHNFTTHW